MCKHATIIDDGMCICMKCGIILERECDVSIMTYSDSVTRIAKKKYSRLDRFVRQLNALSGLQNIPLEIMEQISPCTNPNQLRLSLTGKLKKHISKIASIWRQLGYQFNSITLAEKRHAANLFNEIKVKKSFLVLVPWLLVKIGRSDLLCFCKRSSVKMQEKYNLFINEDVWHETRSLVWVR